MLNCPETILTLFDVTHLQLARKMVSKATGPLLCFVDFSITLRARSTIRPPGTEEKKMSPLVAFLTKQRSWLNFCNLKNMDKQKQQRGGEEKKKIHYF